jgi:sugar phosphate isomerase/epimerase
MWNGTVRALPFAEQVAATAAAGFDQLSVTPLDWTHWVGSGLGSHEMRAIAADHGVQLSHLDPLTRWTMPWQPTNLDRGKYPLPYFAFETEDFLRIAEAIGATSFSAIATAPLGRNPIDRLTEDYARLCDRAAQSGLVCELEFIPLDWSIPDLTTAWQIVRDAGRPNSGIVLDLWHFVRSGSTIEQLRAIPGSSITSVQLADATAQVPPGRDLVDDCLLHRVPVGEGDMPIDEILSVLADLGALRRVGPEYFSRELDAMSADLIGSLCRRSVESLFATADAQPDR